MIKHVVEQGECFSTIAAKYGFADYKTLYNAAANATLKRKRPNPNVLFPGDVIVIPDKKESQVQAPTSRQHNYQVRRTRSQLKLNLINNLGEPIAKTQCVLCIGNNELPGVSDDNGAVEFQVPTEAKEAKLTFWKPSDQQDTGFACLDLQIGGLDPIEEISGSQARLNNLGFAAGEPASGEAQEQYKRAVQRFQTAYNLSATGQMDAPARDKLDKTHDVYDRYESK